MNEGTAIDLAEKRMAQTGITDFLIRYRHLQIAPLATVEIEGDNQFFFLIQPNSYIKVTSKAGVFNIQNNAINEMQYEHRGKIKVTNLYGNRYLHAKFIQVIPITKNTHNGSSR